MVQNIKGLRRIRFWMRSGEQYITHLRVLQNVGMTSIEPVKLQGQPIIPLEFLKAVCRTPARWRDVQGQTSNGVHLQRRQGGVQKDLMILTCATTRRASKRPARRRCPIRRGVRR